jgi:hypothetical protein
MTDYIVNRVEVDALHVYKQILSKNFDLDFSTNYKHKPEEWCLYEY